MTLNSPDAGGKVSARCFFVLLALALLVLPMMFGNHILVSPVLLFGVAVITTVANHLIPGAGDKNENRLFSRIFYMRLAASFAVVLLLLAIDHAARVLQA